MTLRPLQLALLFTIQVYDFNCSQTLVSGHAHSIVSMCKELLWYHQHFALLCVCARCHQYFDLWFSTFVAIAKMDAGGGSEREKSWVAVALVLGKSALNGDHPSSISYAWVTVVVGFMASEKIITSEGCGTSIHLMAQEGLALILRWRHKSNNYGASPWRGHPQLQGWWVAGTRTVEICSQCGERGRGKVECELESIIREKYCNSTFSRGILERVVVV